MSPADDAPYCLCFYYMVANITMLCAARKMLYVAAGRYARRAMAIKTFFMRALLFMLRAYTSHQHHHHVDAHHQDMIINACCCALRRVECAVSLYFDVHLRVIRVITLRARYARDEQCQSRYAARYVDEILRAARYRHRQCHAITPMLHELTLPCRHAVSLAIDAADADVAPAPPVEMPDAMLMPLMMIAAIADYALYFAPLMLSPRHHMLLSPLQPPLLLIRRLLFH